MSLGSFARITRHPVHGHTFEMHSIAALAVVLGFFFLWGARRRELARPAGFLALGSAVAVIVPEIVYLPTIKGTLFVPDLVEEIIISRRPGYRASLTGRSFIALVLVWALWRS